MLRVDNIYRAIYSMYATVIALTNKWQFLQHVALNTSRCYRLCMGKFSAPIPKDAALWWPANGGPIALLIAAARASNAPLWCW